MSWMEEQRHATRGDHRCSTCVRPIDDEPYTRTAIPESTQHRRSFFVLKQCRDCRPI